MEFGTIYFPFACNYFVVEQFWGEAWVACSLKLTAIGRVILAQHTRCSVIVRRIERSKKLLRALLRRNSTLLIPPRYFFRNSLSGGVGCPPLPRDHGRAGAPPLWSRNGSNSMDPFDPKEGMVYGPPWEGAMRRARRNRAFWQGCRTKATAGIFA